MESKILTYRSLKDQKEYLKIIAANMINRFGDSIDSIAFSWMVYQLTKSPSMMALVLAVNFIPTILLQPIAGVFVDNLDKRTVMVLCDLGRGIVVALTGFLFMLGYINPTIIILCVIINSTLESLRVPAGLAVVPKLLDQEKYTIGTALNSTLCRTLEIIGLALAGPIIALLGVEGALIIDGMTFLISAAIIGVIKIKENLARKELNLIRVKESFFEGYKYLRSKPILWAVVIMGLCMNFINVPMNVFATAYITDFIKGGPEVLSLVQLSLVTGAAFGSFITPKLHKFSNKMLFTVAGFVGVPVYVAYFILPEVQSYQLRCIFLIAIIVLFGISVGIQNVIFSSTFMKHVDGSYMGRIGGITNAILSASMPVGSLICSLIVALVTIPQVMLFTSVLIFILYTAIGSRRIYNQL